MESTEQTQEIGIEGKEDESQAQGERRTYANTSLPAAFVNHYVLTAKETGEQYDKAIVNLPDGTQSNGIPLAGYSFDAFLNEYQMSSLVSGEPVRFKFREDKKVCLFKEEEGEPRKEINIDPWALVKAIKAEKEEFKASKETERKAARSPSERAALAKGAASAASPDEAPTQVASRSL